MLLSISQIKFLNKIIPAIIFLLTFQDFSTKKSKNRIFINNFTGASISHSPITKFKNLIVCETKRICKGATFLLPLLLLGKQKMRKSPKVMTKSK